MSGRVSIFKRTIRSQTGRSFDSIVRGSIGADVGTAYYVDHNVGKSGNDGLGWDTAVDTITTALAKVVSGNNDYIFVRGDHRYTSGFIDVTKSQVHIIGADANPVSIDRANAENNPIIRIRDANEVELANFDLDAQWTAGAKGTGGVNSLAAVDVNGDTDKAFKVHIHHCQFAGTRAKCGIQLWGTFYVDIEDCYFNNFTADAGIGIESSINGSVQNAVRNCWFQLSQYAIRTRDAQVAHENLAVDIYGAGISSALIYLGNAAVTHMTIARLYGDLAKAALFAGGNGAATTIANIFTNYASLAADCWGNNGQLAA